LSCWTEQHWRSRSWGWREAAADVKGPSVPCAVASTNEGPCSQRGEVKWATCNLLGGALLEATTHQMGIYANLILPRAMQIQGERVNGEQMVGAGKMGVRQQPWMQRRVKDGIEMHGQRWLWRRAFRGAHRRQCRGSCTGEGHRHGRRRCSGARAMLRYTKTTALGMCVRGDGGAGSRDESGMG
jgi:hypothetical protein